MADPYTYIEVAETQMAPTGAYLIFEGESGVGDFFTINLETEYIQIELAEESI